MSLPAGSLDSINREIVACRLCPRLVAWREAVALERRASFRDWDYWGRPVPGFGDPQARLLVVGLAPAAHGGNRTGRVFTGDSSGDWLYGSLYRSGFASQAESTHRDDGLVLGDAYVSAAVRCAPPANKPTPDERDACQPFLERELGALGQLQVVVPLGAFAYEAVCRVLAIRPRPRFGHLVELVPAGGPAVVCSYHPSQHNTFTGRLTKSMLDAVFVRARAIMTG